MRAGGEGTPGLGMRLGAAEERKRGEGHLCLSPGVFCERADMVEEKKRVSYLERCKKDTFWKEGRRGKGVISRIRFHVLKEEEGGKKDAEKNEVKTKTRTKEEEMTRQRINHQC
jgi:hypothetical protein